MDGQHLWVADEELPASNPPAPTSFYLDDDAFADGDDNDTNYEFSLTAIRAELARAVSSPTSIEESHDDDAEGETSVPHAGISGTLLVRMTAYYSMLNSPALQACVGGLPRW
jgi:hypothetical protein